MWAAPRRNIPPATNHLFPHRLSVGFQQDYRLQRWSHDLCISDVLLLNGALDHVRVAWATAEIASDAADQPALLVRALSSHDITLGVLVQQLIRSAFRAVAGKKKQAKEIGMLSLLRTALQVELQGEVDAYGSHVAQS